jgi:DNA-binding transcriptional MerR regulator
VTKRKADSQTTPAVLRAGDLARLTGVSTDTLRHYERKGLLAAQRQPNGYRVYAAQAVERVRLIRSALAIGFGLDELARVLRVRDAGGAPCRQVRLLAATRLTELETLIGELCVMRDELRELLHGWDVRLAQAQTEPARLLDTLAATSFSTGQRHQTLVAHSWKPKAKQRRKPQ